MNRPAEPPAPEWPITVIADWRDPGYNRFEVRLGVGLAATWLWIAAVSAVLDDRLDPRAFVIPLVVAAWFGWLWLHRRPSDVEATLEPERLLIRDGAGAPCIEVPRLAAGMLLAAERSLDWRERVLALISASDRVVLRVRVGICAVRFPGAAQASDEWWRSTMPPGTSPERPPTAVSVTSLIGAWWPKPDDRRSVRGNLGVQSRWKEPDLITYTSLGPRTGAPERPHRDYNAALRLRPRRRLHVALEPDPDHRLRAARCDRARRSGPCPGALSDLRSRRVDAVLASASADPYEVCRGR